MCIRDRISLTPAEVAGYTVDRSVQTNFGIILGVWDHNIPAFEGRDRSQEYWHTTEEVENNQWYILDTSEQTGFMPGAIFDISVTDNEQLKAGIEARSTRVFNFIEETHSKNFYSAQAADYTVKYMEQTLGYNCGELEAADTQPLPADNIIYLWRELFNLCLLYTSRAPARAAARAGPGIR